MITKFYLHMGFIEKNYILLKEKNSDFTNYITMHVYVCYKITFSSKTTLSVRSISHKEKTYTHGYRKNMLFVFQPFRHVNSDKSQEMKLSVNEI